MLDLHLWANNYPGNMGSTDVVRIKNLFEAGSVSKLEKLVTSRRDAKKAARDSTFTSATGLLSSLGTGMCYITHMEYTRRYIGKYARCQTWQDRALFITILHFKLTGRTMRLCPRETTGG